MFVLLMTATDLKNLPFVRFQLRLGQHIFRLLVEIGLSLLPDVSMKLDDQPGFVVFQVVGERGVPTAQRW